jgi:hypothetical protein
MSLTYYMINKKLNLIFYNHIVTKLTMSKASCAICHKFGMKKCVCCKTHKPQMHPVYCDECVIRTKCGTTCIKCVKRCSTCKQYMPKCLMFECCERVCKKCVLRCSKCIKLGCEKCIMRCKNGYFCRDCSLVLKEKVIKN